MSIIVLNIEVADLDTARLLYDRIEVWRSPDKSGNPTPYAEITAAEAQPAKLVGSVAGPWVLSGVSLTVVPNETPPVTVTFSGTNPLDLQTVLNQINAALPGLASEAGSATDRVQLISQISGTQSSLVVSGAAAAVLGLSTAKVAGKAPRLALSDTTRHFTFYDLSGGENDWYKIRYSSSISGAMGDFSDPLQGEVSTVLPENRRCLAKIWLAAPDGTPVADRRIIFSPVTPLGVADAGGNPYWVLPGFDRRVVSTNDRGYAEISLVRGMHLRVFIEGTGYNREITVPDAETFNVLEAMSAQPDPFSIVSTPPMPIRVS